MDKGYYPLQPSGSGGLQRACTGIRVHAPARHVAHFVQYARRQNQSLYLQRHCVHPPRAWSACLPAAAG